MWRGVYATSQPSADIPTFAPAYCRAYTVVATGLYTTGTVPSPLVAGSSNLPGQCQVNNGGVLTYIYAGGNFLGKWTASQCVPNSTISGQNCVCNSGYTESNGACVTQCPVHQTLINGVCTSDCVAKKNQVASSGYYENGNDPAASFPVTACDGTCTVTFEGSWPAVTSLVNGLNVYYGMGSYGYSGDACSAASSNLPVGSAAPAPKSCGAGDTMAQVNGKSVCLHAGVPTDPNAAKPKPTTTTTSSTSSNPDGTSTKTTTTTNPDGSKTTTTTTTNPDGSTTESKVDTPKPNEDPKVDICKENPEAAVCKKKTMCEENPDLTICKVSTFTGSCGSFTCDGDAIQCAMAREQHDRNCILFDTPTATSDLGNAVVNGVDPLGADIANMKEGSTFDMQTNFQNAQGGRWLGGGGLPSVSISAMGQSFNFDTSLLTEFFSALGYVFVAVAGVVAIRIVGGSSNN